jgi:mRNA interferase MazF
MVTSAGYVPDRGDAVFINMSPQAGHEQAGRRPAVVITPLSYNRKVGLAIFCPVTSQIKKYPFEVVIPINLKIKGVVLSDQVKSLDWKARKAEFICTLPDEVVREILMKANTLMKAEDRRLEGSS